MRIKVSSKWTDSRGEAFVVLERTRHAWSGGTAYRVEYENGMTKTLSRETVVRTCKEVA